MSLRSCVASWKGYAESVWSVLGSFFCLHSAGGFSSRLTKTIQQLGFWEGRLHGSLRPTDIDIKRFAWVA